MKTATNLRNSMRSTKSAKQVVEEDAIKSGLSHLGPCETGEYAYLHLSLKDQNLTSIAGVEKFIHLQHIDLSKNRITSLRPLSSIKHLLTLGAANNKLTKLLDFDAPQNLLYVDYSTNLLTSMGNLKRHKYIQILKLDQNSISEITGIDELPNLQFLSLNENKITYISGLPLSIQQLYLAHNQISKIGTGLQGLVNLRILDLSYNQISSLRGLEESESLMTLLLRGNGIRKVNSLSPIVDLALLSDIDLTENPVVEKQMYRLRVAYKLPQLRSLDNEHVTAEEKIKAENLYGLDLEDRMALFNQIFPNQTFVDRRTFTSEMLDYESDSDREDLNFIDQYQAPKSSASRSSSSRIGSSRLSKVNSRESIDSVTMGEILAFSKRYVGDLIEKIDSERAAAAVSFVP
ncbi:unnamed protein product [Blepharisma stoltei]|uniref:Uncharacterized protein n=1 Tax=Blepharisma stoltei TaxID=1481888 RepID=A0AAU9K1V4_9CILI|nr:unnamed protein product [Blepharisma stoltei]